MPKTTLALVFLAWFGVLGFLARGFVENTDTDITLHAARAWALRGNPGLVLLEDRERLVPGEETWPGECVVALTIANEEYRRSLGIGAYGRTGPDGRQYPWFPIGHQALLVPVVWAGETLATWFPAAEQNYKERSDRLPELKEFYWSRFLTSFVSPLFAAGSIVLLILLAIELRCGPKAAAWIAAFATLSTQFLPGATETMSNVPGAFFLYATALAVARYARRKVGWWLGVAGLTCGLGVLLRYPILLSMLPLLAFGAACAWRRRQPAAIGLLVVGGLPGLVALLAANHWRFGSVFETGYSGESSFGSESFPIGVLGILFAPGKGAMWFSLPLWIAAWLLLRRAGRQIWRWPFSGGAERALVPAAALAFVVPVLAVANLWYWGAGQCWGIRYLTGPIVLLVVVTGAVFRDVLADHLVRVVAVGVVGLLVSIGGLIAPYTGQQALAYTVVRAQHGPFEFGGDDDRIFNFSLQLSPIHSHWTYAWLSATGRLGSRRSADTTEPLFGVELEDPTPPLLSDELGFRHFWWRNAPRFVPGLSGVLAALAWLAATGGVAWLARRRWLRLVREP